jgi:arylformamidase
MPPAGGRLVELSHVIRAGMVTYPGLPGPQITPYLTREASREHYAPGTEFAIDRLRAAPVHQLSRQGAWPASWTGR